MNLATSSFRSDPNLGGQALQAAFSEFPQSVLKALYSGLESTAIRLAATFGLRDEARLSSLVFYVRHPERGGRSIQKNEPDFRALSQEWLDIRDRLVRPILAGGTPSGPSPGAPPAGALQYGVPGGRILSSYLKSRSRGYHTGIDISTSSSPGGGADDPRRGLPVYATVRTSIEIATLNSIQVALRKAPPWQKGLRISGAGAATLRDVRIRIPPSGQRSAHEYGGVAGLACRYTYTTTSGTPGLFTLFVEYWHLITPEYLPKTGKSRILTLAEWRAAGKGNRMGLGPKMVNGAVLPAEAFRTSPPLVGFLGATQWPHVHVHVGYGTGEKAYVFYPRLDPAAVIR